MNLYNKNQEEQKIHEQEHQQEQNLFGLRLRGIDSEKNQNLLPRWNGGHETFFHRHEEIHHKIDLNYILGLGWDWVYFRVREQYGLAAVEVRVQLG